MNILTALWKAYKAHADKAAFLAWAGPAATVALIAFAATEAADDAMQQAADEEGCGAILGELRRQVWEAEE